MSDEELKASIQKRGEFAVGDMVTCKRKYKDHYGITTPGVRLRVYEFFQGNTRFKAKIADESHDQHGYEFDLTVKDFELM